METILVVIIMRSSPFGALLIILHLLGLKVTTLMMVKGVKQVGLMPILQNKTVMV